MVVEGEKGVDPVYGGKKETGQFYSLFRKTFEIIFTFQRVFQQSANAEHPFCSAAIFNPSLVQSDERHRLTRNIVGVITGVRDGALALRVKL